MRVKRKGVWNFNFAYAIGLLVTDGNLSKDGRHIDFTSKDKEQINNLARILKINNKIGIKYSGSGQKSFRIQFGNVLLYKFLMNIGIGPRKSKSLSAIKIPEKYFFDFLRGHFDGDGTFYSYFDPRWKSSFMLYLEFISGSKSHIMWLQNKILKHAKIEGKITKSKNNSAYRLKFAKYASLQILPKIYYHKSIISLKRKQIKIERALKIANKF